MQDAYEKWDALCKEFEAARDENFAAFAAVSRGFIRVANNSGGNPTDEELAAYEQTWERLEELKRLMDEFVKANT